MVVHKSAKAGSRSVLDLSALDCMPGRRPQHAGKD